VSQIIITGSDLTIEDIIRVARYDAEVKLAESARKQIKKAHSWVKEIIAKGDPVYGINTGFGIFAERRIPDEEAIKLSRNLILSHAVGTGLPLEDEIVRAAMLIRANTLAKGHSGVRLEVVEILLELLNKKVTPIIPSQGSLGSSGDLSPLSHLALVFSTDENDDESESGQARFEGQIYSGKEAMQRAGIDRIILGAKEGLAVNNGATFSAAIAALAVHDAGTLLKSAEITLAMTLEAVKGRSSAFDQRLHEARGHKGQLQVAQAVRELISGSSLIDSYDRVQDAYSLRCAPQVQGVARDTLAFVRQIIETEINAATDNPLLFSPEDVLSGGNFHGEPIGMAMDFLSIALSEVASISERRIYRLMDEGLNAGLPPMLVDHCDDAGLNSGLMMLQYTAASLVLENQTLATPDSVHSLPTSGGQEDHNANSMTAARHAQEIIKNTAHVLAIEMYSASRAFDLRLQQDPSIVFGAGTAVVYNKIRDQIAFLCGDALWGPEVEQMRRLILEQKLV
jgi:histidine ammonia-lyase